MKDVIKDEQEYWDFVDSINLANKLAENEKQKDRPEAWEQLVADTMWKDLIRRKNI